MRACGGGKRWLLLRGWKTMRGSKRRELKQLFAANRRLFKAYVLREQLDRLWIYKTREGVVRFLLDWLKALRWQRLPEMEKLGDTLVNRFDGIAAYCDHPVRFGFVESLPHATRSFEREIQLRIDKLSGSKPCTERKCDGGPTCSGLYESGTIAIVRSKWVGLSDRLFRYHLGRIVR